MGIFLTNLTYVFLIEILDFPGELDAHDKVNSLTSLKQMKNIDFDRNLL